MSVFQVQLTQPQNSQIAGGGPAITSAIQPVLTGDGSMDTWAQSNTYGTTALAASIAGAGTPYSPSPPISTAVYNGVNSAGVGGSYQRTIYAMGPNKVNRKLKDGAIFTDCNYWLQFCAAPVGPLSQTDAFLVCLYNDGSTYVPGQQSVFTRTYAKTLVGGSTYTTANNIINVLSDNGGPAVFATFENNGANTISVQLNGQSNSIFTMAASNVITFNLGDTTINTIAFSNATSSATSNAVQVILGIASTCSS